MLRLLLFEFAAVVDSENNHVLPLIVFWSSMMMPALVTLSGDWLMDISPHLNSFAPPILEPSAVGIMHCC